MKIKELGHVVLYVRSLEKSAHFYRDILGFPEVFGNESMIAFSTPRTHHELLLIEVGGEIPPKNNPRPGLYHIGLKIGDSPEDARKAYEELREKNVPVLGTADHGVTHSLYILDPDENEIELYADVSDEWKKNPQAIATPPKPLDFHS